MLRRKLEKSDVKNERRRGLFIEDSYPFIILESFNESTLYGICKREDNFTLKYEQQMSNRKSPDQHEASEGNGAELRGTKDDDKSKDQTKSKIFVSKTHQIVQEMIQNEEKYIKSLKNGINDYIVPFDRFPLPKTLIGQRLHIFSNIEVILEFHEKRFYPELLECGHDPEKVADIFVRFVQANSFDNYISYVESRKTSSKLCEENKYFFKQLEKDLLGVESFLHQPVQRLPKYQLILDKLIKELTYDLKKNKTAIAKCCKAEKSILKLLNVVNQHCE